MIGITSYGAYIPVLRMNREIMSKAWNKTSLGGERSIANHDEDSLTMAVEAALNCLQGQERNDIEGLFFASTTAPYREKQMATLVAETADLTDLIRVADYANSGRAGTAALRSALDAVTAQKSSGNFLTVAADCRLAYPQSEMEQTFGDGAAALTVGSSQVIANFLGHYTVAHEMMDVWRNAEDIFVQSWEKRWVIGEGYTKQMQRVVSGLLTQQSLSPRDIAHVALCAPDARSHRSLAQKLGFDLKTQVLDPLLGNVGDCGAAQPLMLLVSALEKAKEGDKILLAAYGNGAEAFLFQVSGEIGRLGRRRGIKENLQNKIPLTSYEKYLSFRGLLKTLPGEPFRLLPSATAYWRDRRSILRFHGSKCRSCGTVTFPVQRVCYTCRTKDLFDEVRLSDIKGKVYNYTIDNLAGRSDDPVVVQTIVESELEKARIYCMMTDCQPSEVKIGMPVEFTFRRIYEGAGFQNYFWKCRPLREGRE